MRSRTPLLLASLVTAALAAAGCSRSSESSSSSSNASVNASSNAPSDTATMTPAKPQLKKLTVDEVSTRIAAKDGKTFVYDNNPKERYDQGHVPGARWVESGDVTAAILPADKSATLIFYCANEA